MITTGLSVFGTLLSGLGKLRLSLYQSLFVMLINIPLSIWLAGFSELGSAGVILASLICALSRVFQPVQAIRLLRGTARGVWNK
jgi:O-antigen/teichoic acid export membrane protein